MMKCKKIYNNDKFLGFGVYNLIGMGSDSMRRVYIESTRKGVFGITFVRIKLIIKKEEVEVSGSVYY